MKQLCVHILSPGLPRLFVVASDVKAGRPGRISYVRLGEVDTNVTSCHPNVKLPKRLSPYCTDSRLNMSSPSHSLYQIWSPHVFMLYMSDTARQHLPINLNYIL